MTSKRPTVVVIGAGFGGLAAAIRLQARGFAVTLIDKRDQAGGRAYVYRDAGFAFDGGPTVVTAPFLFDELWALCGKRREDHLTFLPVDPFYRIRFDDGRVFDYSGDEERNVEQIKKFNPADADGYRALLRESERIYHVGFEELGDIPFGRMTDMLKIVPKMIKLRSHLSVHGWVRRYIKDEALRTVLSFHPLLVGGNPFSTTSIYALIAYLEKKWGVWFAKGGTGAIVDAMVELFVSQGGTLELSTEAERIEIEGGRVRGVTLKGGRRLDTDLVVANGDAPHIYKYLIEPQHRRKNTDAKIDKLRYSMGLFVAYFGTKKTYPDLAHHTILLGPRYRELLADIFDKKLLAEDFSMYLHAPRRTDPSPNLAPPGHENFYVLAPVPHLGGGQDWDQLGQPFCDRVFDALEKTVIPGLRDNLVTSRFITPKTFKHDMNSELGAAFSIQPVLMQSAYMRFHNQSEDIRGLFIVGAGTHPGAGLPGVLSTAKVVDRLIADRDGTGNPRDPIAGTHARWDRSLGA